MRDRSQGGALRGRLGRAARLGLASARASAGWLAGAAVRGLGRGAASERLRRSAAAEIADGLGRLKGVAMKLGQVLSFAVDDLPVELRDALARLQTTSPPRPFSDLVPVIERSLGRPLREAFASVDPTPAAAASIGQVHRARLPDGTAAAVKVQYPDVAAAVRADVSNLSLVVRLVRLLAPRVDARRVAEELRGRLLEELDYVAEARRQATFATRFEGHPFIAIPPVVPSRCGAEVLTTRWADGVRFQQALAAPEPLRSRMAEILFRFAWGCVAEWGTIDGDPHPGNYLFDPGAARVTFLDFGCVKELPAHVHGDLRRFLRARLDGDRAASREAAVTLGFVEAAPWTTVDRIVDALDLLYLPFGRGAPERFPSPWAGAPGGVLGEELAEVRGNLAIPPDLVFVNRALVGMYLVLARLGPTADWGRIAGEYARGDPPATALGEAERAWRSRQPGDA